MIHNEVRKKIVEAKRNGVTVKEICRVNNVGKSAVYDLLKQAQETGIIDPQTHLRGRKPTLDENGLAEIKAKIEEQCDITAAEIKDALGLSLCESSICKIIKHKLGYRYKKRRYTPVNESAQT